MVFCLISRDSTGFVQNLIDWAFGITRWFVQAWLESLRELGVLHAYPSSRITLFTT